MEPPFDAIDFAQRLGAVEARLERLAQLPLPDTLTEPDPESEERWEPAQVWGHVSELVPYWLGEARKIVDGATTGAAPVRYGRLATDAIRIDAIEQRRHWSQDERWSAVRADLQEVQRFVRELPPEAFAAQGLHPTGAVRTVSYVLEQGVLAHVEQHADQLERLALRGGPGDVVRRLWDRFEARDWDGAAAVLASDVVVDWPATQERIVGRENVLGVNSSYPEPWGHIVVLRLFEADEQVAAEVRVRADDANYYCAGFYEVRAGLITRGTEYWVTEGGEQPPFDRSRWTEPVRP